jgi:uncharacterized membrane protein
MAHLSPVAKTLPTVNFHPFFCMTCDLALALVFLRSHEVVTSAVGHKPSKFWVVCKMRSSIDPLTLQEIPLYSSVSPLVNFGLLVFASHAPQSKVLRLAFEDQHQAQEWYALISIAMQTMPHDHQCLENLPMARAASQKMLSAIAEEAHQKAA